VLIKIPFEKIKIINEDSKFLSLKIEIKTEFLLSHLLPPSLNNALSQKQLTNLLTGKPLEDFCFKELLFFSR